MIKHTNIFCLIFVFILFNTLSGQISISGTYLDKTSNPIADAVVKYYVDDSLIDSTTTDDKGYFEIYLKDLFINDVPMPNTFSLSQNYPNPFNPMTHFKCNINKPSTFTIYNILGQQIVQKSLSIAGSYNISWGGQNHLGKNVSAGIYIVVLKSTDQMIARRITLLDGGNGAGLEINNIARNISNYKIGKITTSNEIHLLKPNTTPQIIFLSPITQDTSLGKIIGNVGPSAYLPLSDIYAFIGDTVCVDLNIFINNDDRSYFRIKYISTQDSVRPEVFIKKSKMIFAPNIQENLYVQVVATDSADTSLKLTTNNFSLVSSNTFKSPQLIADIPNQTIIQDSVVKLLMTNYFYDEDSKDLSYRLLGANPFVLEQKNDTVVILPDSGWYGQRSNIIISASDGYSKVLSNPWTFKVIPIQIVSDSLRADVGPDQTCSVGEYVIINTSSSTCPTALGNIVFWEWTSDINNPDDTRIRSKSGATETLWEVGFTKEGVYRYYLRITPDMTNWSDSALLIINVLPAESSLIRDKSLEVYIRQHLTKPTGLISLHELQNLDSLRTSLSMPEVKSIDGLQHCVSLKSLFLDLQAISDLSPLSDLTNLEILSVNQNWNISDISPLQNLVNCYYLNIFGNNVSDLSPINNLKRLKYLNIISNPIDNIDALYGLNQLEELWMQDLKSGDLTPIQESIKMRQLWAPECNITDLSPLVNMSQMIYLFLKNNSIQDIGPIRKMSNLVRLYLDNNNIHDISVLDSLNNLDILSLDDNQIQNIKSIFDNPGIGSGDAVGLRNNPLDSISIHLYIPELKKRGVNVFYP